jgi:iron complex transport system permease protein
MKARSKRFILAAMAAGALLTLVFCPFPGMKAIPVHAAWNPDGGLESLIFWRIRVPRVALAFVVGALLSLSGMTFQAFFRNPLATPFTLGTAAGASLGAAVCIRFGWVFMAAGVSSVSLFAFGGALFSIGAVYALASRSRCELTGTLLLAGVALSFFFSSLILFMQYLSDYTRSFQIMRWLMGGLDSADWESVLRLLPFALSGSVLVFFQSRELNLLAGGEEIAAGRGLDVMKTRTILFLGASLMVGGVVSVCGPIGFVGMMCPHMARLWVGSDHRRLAPASLLFGGTFLVLCDTLARTLVAPAEIPVGVLTALLGGPFFIWLLLTRAPGSVGFRGEK